jgi:hypothetical protein
MVLSVFFFWSWCCLSFFELRPLITSFVSSNISYANCNDVVMVSVLASKWGRSWAQANDYKIRSCCFSTSQADLRSKSKDWLARIQDNVSK